MTIRANNINSVLSKCACSGCGACNIACSVGSISIKYGNRYNYPEVNPQTCVECGKCLKVCPSAFLLGGTKLDYADEPLLERECFILHSVDNALRHDAASGGFVTALILHLLESGKVDGAIVARCQGSNPLLAESLIARDREALLSARGSKYAPVSSCTALKEVMEKPGRYVFVGTPCMLEGVDRLSRLFPKIKDRIVLKIGLVCAGMASRASTRNYIEREGGVKISDARRICYRGDGWPGRFRVFGDGDRLLMDRPLLGGSLQNVVGIDYYLRCYNCLDHWAHFADISVSDPWTKEMVEKEREGRSAIMVRTEEGHEAVQSAMAAGCFVAESITANIFVRYNQHLHIGPYHSRHAYMGLYQALFFGRLHYLGAFLKQAVKGKRLGLRTTIKARLSKHYYY